MTLILLAQEQPDLDKPDVPAACEGHSSLDDIVIAAREAKSPCSRRRSAKNTQ